MKKETFQHMLNRKTAQVIHALSTMSNTSYDAVFHTFCSSDTYRKLTDEETKYWRESVPYIVESYVAEMNGEPINDDY